MKNYKCLLWLALFLHSILPTRAQTNTPPTAFAQYLTCTQGFPLAITLTASDPDGDALTFTIVGPPVFGSLTGTPPNVLYFAPTNIFSGVLTDSFVFVANDGQIDSEFAAIQISIFPTAPIVNVLATDPEAVEPPPTNTGTFTFTRTGDLQSSLVVLFRIDGTATLNTDYQTSPPLATGSNSTIYFRTIPAGSNSATLTVFPLADSITEGTETVILTLFTNSAYTIGSSGSAIVNILDNTNPPPPLPVLNFVTTDSTAYELTASGGIDTASFTVTRTGTANSVRFPIIVSGTATYGVDYYTQPGFLVGTNATFFDLGSNQTSVVFTLYPIQDTLVEGTETAIFTLGTNVSYTIGPSNQSLISILDGPAPPQLAGVFFPPDGADFASSEAITIKTGATNALELRVYADNQLIGYTNTASGQVTLLLSISTNFPSGEHTAYAVGTNRVGLISNTYTSPPVHFRVLAPLAHNALSPKFGIAPEANASFVLDSNGALFDFGDGRYGALGDGGLTNQQQNAVTNPVTSPIQIPLPGGTNRFVKVSSGSRHTLALTADGSLWSCGDNTFGQTGTGKSTSTFTGIATTPGGPGWKDIAAGNFHSLALDTQGRLYSWGNNGSGQLGLGNFTNSSVPRLVAFPALVTAWTAIGAGSNYSIALGNNGQLYMCGSGYTVDSGGPFVLFALPVPVPRGVTNWLSFAAGPEHVLAVAGNGALYAWGLGDVGQLGFAGIGAVTMPQAVIAPAGVTNWLGLAAGLKHSLGLGGDGNLYSWGGGTSGQLGPGATFSTVPRLVPPPTNVVTWKAIGAGINHSLGVGDNCSVYAWGANNFGQLGIGSFLQQTNLQAVRNLSDLCAETVVTGTNHAPSFVKGPDITVPQDAGIQVFTNWATQINPGAPSETNQILTFIVTNDNPHLFSTQPGITPSGNLFFAGAQNSNGVAHVTVILKDNGGTANGGQDTSTPQTLLITIARPNHAPVPVVRVFPSFVLSSNYSAFQVISPNNSNALVFFDASLSTDVDGDPLAFDWFADGTNELFGTSVVATNHLDIGTYSMALSVNDGHVTVFQPFEVQVISAAEAVGELINVIQNLSALPARNTWKQSISPLEAAQSEFDNELWNAGLVHLSMFQSRVSRQIGATDPNLANNLNQTAQQIIDAVQGNAKNPAKIGSIANRGGNQKTLAFTGTPGQIYLVQASGDLQHWETIGIANETDAGAFKFDDIGSADAPARYYRLVIP
jgi:alpha-tubulin suppressor-like RCC1 family protein